MFNDSELGLFRDTLKKCRVDTALLNKCDLMAKINEHLLYILPGKSDYDTENIFGKRLPVTSNTVYRLTDRFGFSYTYFSPDNKQKDKVLLIGPYLYDRPSANRIFEYAEKNTLSTKQLRYIQEYYTSIAVISKESFLFNMLNSFCERSWNTPSFSIIDINDEYSSPISPIGSIPKEENFDEILANMKAMEKRYKYENELIQAVTLGQMHKESLFVSSFDNMLFEKRVPDLLRNAKNYCVIMNTLLRKAAEAGGVHPMYIDRVSSDLASKIEHMSYLSETSLLMKEIFRTYCRLVQNHTMNGYSEITKNTVLLIDSDISAPLSPSSLAKAQNVSLGYLSTLFKREVGKTLTEFIKAKRIAHAKYLLTTTQLQIQTVALYCGIMDLQYFSKIFKRDTGKTPKQYRESHNQM